MEKDKDNRIVAKPGYSRIQEEIDEIFRERHEKRRALGHRDKAEKSKIIIMTSLAVVMLLSSFTLIYIVLSDRGAWLGLKTDSRQNEEQRVVSEKVRRDVPSHLTEEDFVGTYTFTDTKGCTWELLLAAEGTATICLLSEEGKSSHTFEGEWDYNQQRGFPNIWFPHAESLLVWFPSGRKCARWLCIEDGFVYLTKNALEQQNADLRLAIIKKSVPMRND